jgi:hypothetical protein
MLTGTIARRPPAGGVSPRDQQVTQCGGDQGEDDVVDGAAERALDRLDLLERHLGDGDPAVLAPPAALERHHRRPALAVLGSRRALRHRRPHHPRGAAQAGGERELLAWAADFWSHRLDRGRQLWRMVLLHGRPEGAGPWSPRRITASWTALARSTRSTS